MRAKRKIALALLLSAAAAVAQEAGDDSQSSRYQLEEVIVTAQKRTENVRDVPMALSVFNGDAMKDQGIFGLNDLAAQIPNVSINDTSNSLYVRGIGTAELNPIGEQAIAYIIDGVYVPKFAYLNAGFLDLERMEVLKGPQGTLFGRNATAGVFNITNGTPSQEWIGSVLVTGGNRDILETEGMVSGPITDRLAFRLAAKRRDEDGYTKSTGDNETLGDREQEMARLSFRYDVSETIDVTLGYTQFDYFHGVFLGYEYHAYPEDLRPAIEDSDPNFETVLDRRSSMPRNKGDDFENRSEGKGKIIPLQINWESWGHTFTSVTSFAKVDTFRGGDVDYTALKLVGLTAEINDEQYSQELRITSPPGRFEYIGGLYYFKGKTVSLLQVPLFADFATFAGGGATGDVVGDILAGAVFGDSDVIDNLIADFDLQTISTGIFGQAKWAITDYLALTIGARRSEDEKDADIETRTEGPVEFWSQLTEAPFTVNEVLVDKNFSPKYSITWEPFEEVTFYATLAKGFRAGSYNAGATERDNVSFKAEKSTTFEAGAKTDLLDGRVRWNIGYYQTDYEDYQLSAFTGLGYVTANAPEVEMRGAETDLTAVLLPGLIMKTAVGYNDARFIDHKNGACPSEPASEQEPGSNPASPRNDCDLSGKGLHRAPRWNISFGLDYAVPLNVMGMPMELFAGVDATYKDAEKFDSDLDPLDAEGAYWIYNARFGVGSADGVWRFVVHGKNLSDELRMVWSGDGIAQPGSHYAATNAPKYYFASFSYRY